MGHVLESPSLRHSGEVGRDKTSKLPSGVDECDIFPLYPQIEIICLQSPILRLYVWFMPCKSESMVKDIQGGLDSLLVLVLR